MNLVVTYLEKHFYLNITWVELKILKIVKINNVDNAVNLLTTIFNEVSKKMLKVITSENIINAIKECKQIRINPDIIQKKGKSGNLFMTHLI